MDVMKDNAAAHEKMDASENKFVCLYCSKHFGNISQYDIHMQGHTDFKFKEQKIFECDLCNKKYKQKDSLKHHLKQHHTPKLSMCKFCNKRYLSEACLKKHELAHVKNVFQCRFCTKNFTSKEEYHEHNKIKHPKSYVCSSPNCKLKFYTKENLEKHRRLFCTKEVNQFVCESCGKQFRLKGNLKVHNESKCGTERTYKCEVCGKNFMTRPSLATHHLLHTGEKKFVCKFCGKSHRTKGEVKRHELIHTRDKPFVCKVCLKGFAHRETLVTHSTLHTGIKPYMCDGCGKGFSCVGNLIKHRKSHAKCMTSESHRNKPRIKKPSIHSLLVDVVELHHSQDENVPMTTVKPFVCTQYSNNHPPPVHNSTSNDPLFSNPYPNRSPDPQKNICEASPDECSDSKDDDNLPRMDPLTYRVSSENLPDPLSMLPKQSEEGSKEIQSCSEVGRNYISKNINSDAESLSDPCSMNLALFQAYFITSDFVNCASSVKTKSQNSVTQKLTNSNGIMRKNSNSIDNEQATIQPFSTNSNNITPDNINDVGAAVVQSTFVVDTVLSGSDQSKNEDYQRDRPAIKCDDGQYVMDTVALDIASSSGPVVSNADVNTDKSKLKKSEFEDQRLLGMKSSVVISDADDCDERKEIDCDTPTSVKVTVIKNSDNLYTCSLCKKCFHEEGRLSWHMKTHNSRYINKNKEVEYVSEDDEPLGIRLLRHNAMLKAKQKIPCQYCLENFNNEKDYKHHKRKHHSGTEKPSFQCSHCPKVYKIRKALLKHELLHSGGNSQCKKCDRTFRGLKEYQIHLQNSHRKQHTCNHCGHSFVTSAALKSHISSNHGTKEKTLSCDACRKLFKHHANLARHIRTRCGASPMFVCKTCGKSYLSEGSFEVHQQLHAGLRVFLCKFCGRNFQHKCVLLIHELTHTGEKPFVCPICSKAFTHQISLTTHSSIHSGIKPYKCEGCGSGFSCFGNLKKHRLTHMSTCGHTKIRKTQEIERHAVVEQTIL